MSLNEAKEKHDFGFDGGLRRARKLIEEFGCSPYLEGAIAAALADAFELGYAASEGPNDEHS